MKFLTCSSLMLSNEILIAQSLFALKPVQQWISMYIIYILMIFMMMMLSRCISQMITWFTSLIQVSNMKILRWIIYNSSCLFFIGMVVLFFLQFRKYSGIHSIFKRIYKPSLKYREKKKVHVIESPEIWEEFCHRILKQNIKVR